MQKKLKNSLKYALQTLFSKVIFISVILLQCIVLLWITSIKFTDTLSQSQKNLELVHSTIEEYYNLLTENTKYLSTDLTFQSLLKNESHYKENVFTTKLYSAITSRTDLYKFINSGKVILNNDTYFDMTTRSLAPWSNSSSFIERANNRIEIIYNSETKKNYLSKKIIDTTTGESLGLLLVQLNNAYLETLKKTFQNEKYEFVMFDLSSKNIISSSTKLNKKKYDQQLISKFLVGENDGLSLGRPFLYISSQDYDFVTLHYFSFLMVTKDLIPLFFTLLFCFFLIYFIIKKWISRFYEKMLSPLIILGDYSTKIGEGKILPQLTLESYSEINVLRDNFNRMISNLEILKAEIFISQEDKKETDLALMQQQMNPHFLYNCLDTILYFNEGAEIETANKMLFFMSKYYQTVLNNGDTLISIKDEIQLLESYIKIQQLKNNQEFEYKIDIPPNFLSVKILKMVIQPFVENVFLHGFYKLNHKGILNIKITSVKKCMTINIIDNGVGFNSEEIASSRENFGINSVDKRIKLAFGEDYGVQIFSEIQKGTTVKVIFPLTQKGEY